MNDQANNRPHGIDDLDERLRAALADERMPTQLEESTLAYITVRARRLEPKAPGGTAGPKRRAGQRCPSRRRFAQLMVACLVVGALAAGTFAYAAETAQVYVDGGTAVELGLNRWNRVVRVDGGNPELDALLDELDLVGSSCEDALEALANSDAANELLAGDSAITIVASCNNERQLGAALGACEAAAQGFGAETRCIAGETGQHGAGKHGANSGPKQGGGTGKGNRWGQAATPDATP